MRNAGLDLLRLLAVILVLGRHLLPTQSSNSVLAIWQTGGWVGVDLFFVLSGFLVSGLLFTEYKRKGSVDIKRFMIRRGFKIYPPLVLLIAVTVGVTVLQGQPVRVRQTASELLMMQNYGGALWNHTWSLAVEWHFYIFLCVLFVFLLKEKAGKEAFRWVPWVFVGIAILCLLARLVTSWAITSSGPENHKWLYYGTHIRLDSLMFGVLLAYLWHFRDLEEKTRGIPTLILVVAGCLLFLPAFVFDLDRYSAISVYGFTCFYIASGLLLLAATRLGDAKGRLLALFVVLGAASYSIYLWHMAVNWWLWPVFSSAFSLSLEQNYEVYLAFFVLTSLALGYWLNHLIEQPSLKLREQMFPSKASRNSMVTKSSAHSR